MHWELVSVTIGLLTLWISIMALGLPMLSKLSACVEQLAELRVQWSHCREADQLAHQVFAEKLEDHEERIEDLEGTVEGEGWIGECNGQEDEGPKAA